MIRRLSGGLILLCLTSISLDVTSGEVSITDPDVLEQLKELRTFIDVNRDFSKGFKNLKPVLVEYRSSASKFNGIALGNLSFNTDALHMSIGINTIQKDGKMLIVTINVVYEWVDYIGYQVSSAKLEAREITATSEITTTGDVAIGGDLEVTGDAEIFEKITDASGHKRFIEGNLATRTIAGVTFSYAKWSLSGSHLMIVLAGTIADETAYSSGTAFADAVLPSWILDKIYPIVGSVVIPTNILMFADDYSTQDQGINLNKTDDTLQIRFSANTLTADRTFRVQFDLLIDNN